MKFLEKNREKWLALVKDSAVPTRQEILNFFEEYQQKKTTHLATSLENLSPERRRELLYLELPKGTPKTLLKECTQLKALSVFDDATLDLSCHPHLEVLSIKKAERDSLPVGAGSLSNLWALNLTANESVSFPGAFVHSKKLTFLSFQNEKSMGGGSGVSDAIGELTNLVDADLSHRHNGSLPKGLDQLTYLKKLDLSNNSLEELPKHIGKLESLRLLNLSYNLLSRLPDSILHLNNLIYLDVRGNLLGELPAATGKMANLQVLYADSNKIRQLPAGFGALDKLKGLSLANNRLRALPGEFGNLSSLVKLNLSYNFLHRLPEEFAGLGKLAELDLSNNVLVELPASFSKLTQLGVFNKKNNPFTAMPGVARMEIGELMEHLRKKETVEANHINLKIDRELKTPVSQYLKFFKEYVAVTKKKTIQFEVIEEEDGILLETTYEKDFTTEIKAYLFEYISLVQQNLNDWQPEVEGNVDPKEIDLLRLKVGNNVAHLKNACKIARMENHLLKNENEFLQSLNQQLFS